MRNSIALFAITLCLLFSSCHRPVAYFQPTPHPTAARLSVDKPTASLETLPSDSASDELEQLALIPEIVTNSVSAKPGIEQTTTTQLESRIRRIQSLLKNPASETTNKQPEPKPKKKLKFGNRIRQSLGMPLRKELNWWQRISWKLKASVIVLLVAVLFAILHVTILAIIFGIIGALLLISGLKKSFKVRRPWF